MTQYPDIVEFDSDPEKLPKDALEKAIQYGLAKLACPECGNEQFIGVRDGWNNRFDCEKCEYSGEKPF